MGCREAIFVDKSTFDFPIFLLFFNAKFPNFPVFSILLFLFSYFLSNHAAGHPDIISTNIYLIVIVILTEGIRMFFNTLSKKNRSLSQNNNFIFSCSGIVNLLFDGIAYNTSSHFAHCSYFFSPLWGSEKFYATCTISVPSNKVCVFTIVR